METYRIEFDGGAINNPGPAGIGIVIKSDSGEIMVQHGEGIGEATNNVAEYRALCRGLDLVGELLQKENKSKSKISLQIRTDSQLLANQVNDEWKTNDDTLRELKEEALENLRSYSSWEIKHVPREENSRADSLVTDVLKQYESGRDDRKGGGGGGKTERTGNEELFESGPVFTVFAHGIGSQGDKPGGIAYLVREGEDRDLLLKAEATEPTSSARAAYLAVEAGIKSLLQILDHRPEDEMDLEKPRAGEIALNVYGLNDLVVKQLAGTYDTKKDELVKEKKKVKELLNRFGAFRVQRNPVDVLQDLKKRARKKKGEAAESEEKNSQ